MKLKFIILILAVAVMAGCTTTKITMRGSEPIVIESKSDALITYKKDGEELTVDNRGRPSVFEALLGLVINNTKAEVK